MASKIKTPDDVKKIPVFAWVIAIVIALSVVGGALNDWFGVFDRFNPVVNPTEVTTVGEISTEATSLQSTIAETTAETSEATTEYITTKKAVTTTKPTTTGERAIAIVEWIDRLGGQAATTAIDAPEVYYNLELIIPLPNLGTVGDLSIYVDGVLIHEAYNRLIEGSEYKYFLKSGRGVCTIQARLKSVNGTKVIYSAKADYSSNPPILFDEISFADSY